MSVVRVLSGKPAVISVTLLDHNGEPKDANGTVSCAITNTAGDTVTHGAVTPGSADGVYTVSLTALATAALDVLTCEWTAEDDFTQTSTVEIVGGFYFSSFDVRAIEESTQQPIKYPLDDILRVRNEVEDECYRITGQSFAPRFRRVVLDGDGRSSFLLPDANLRALRSVTVDGTAWEIDQLAELRLNDWGHVSWPYSAFASGSANIIVTYEHGWDSPPEDIKRAAITRLRERLNRGKSGIPDRATTQVFDGGTFSLATPGRNGYKTGNPDVDAVYLDPQYCLRAPAVA